MLEGRIRRVAPAFVGTYNGSGYRSCVVRVVITVWSILFLLTPYRYGMAQSLSELQASAVKRQSVQDRYDEEVKRLGLALSKVMDDHVRAAMAAISAQGVAFEDTKPILDDQVATIARLSFVAFEPVYLNASRTIGAEGLLGINSTYYLSPKGARFYVKINASLFWLSATEACSYQVEVGVIGQTPSEAMYPCGSFGSKTSRSQIVQRIESAVRQSLEGG
jgi:hypothetical protein